VDRSVVTPDAQRGAVRLITALYLSLTPHLKRPLGLHGRRCSRQLHFERSESYIADHLHYAS
jgi:hypothetical protein